MKRKQYLSKEEKIADFILGFIGILLLNLAIYLLLPLIGALVTIDYGGQVSESAQQVSEFIGYAAMTSLPWTVNIAFFAFFAWWRPWIAIGALSAVAFVIVASILAGVCFFVGCLLLLGIISLLSA